MTYNSSMFEAGRGSIYKSPPKSKPKTNPGKQFADSMKKAGIGGLGGKPTTSAAKKIQDRFRRETQKDNDRRGLGASPKPTPTTQKSFLESLYDRVRSSITFAGGDPNRKKKPIPNPAALYTASPFIFPAATAVTASVLGPAVDYTDPTAVPRGTPSIYTPATRDFGKGTEPVASPQKPETARFDVSDLLGLKEKVVFRDAPGLMSPPSMAQPAAPATAMSAAMAEGINKTLQSILSPDPDVPYVIQAGDTLSEIAVKTGTTVEDLVRENKIEKADDIFTGNELKIPSAKATKTKEDIVSSLIGDMGGITKVGSSFEGEGVETAEDKSILQQALDYLGYGKDVTTVNKAGGLGAKQKITTKDTKANITAYQTQLNNLGFNTGTADGAYGKNTAKGIKRYQLHNGLKITGTMNEETAKNLNSGNSIVPTSKKVGNLTVSTAYRDDIEGLVISTDFNGSDNPKANGVEVVLPPAVFNAGPGNQHYDAAVKYLGLVKDFFEKKGYGEYKIRPSNVAGTQAGIKRSGSNPSGRQRGRGNTIHTEPFFSSDTKANNIVNENKEEFFDLYVQAFGNTTGITLVAAHGGINNKNKLDQGAESSVLGSEKDLADEGIKYIMDNY